MEIKTKISRLFDLLYRFYRIAVSLTSIKLLFFTDFYNIQGNSLAFAAQIRLPRHDVRFTGSR